MKKSKITLIICVTVVVVFFLGYLLLKQVFYPYLPEQPALQVQVLFPKGGEQLEIGKTYDIQWKDYSGRDPLTLALQTTFSNGQSSMHNLAENISATSIGNYKWTVAPVDTSYKYKIIVYSGYRNLVGQSSDFFSVVGEQLQNPISSGTTFEFGKPFTISNKLLSGSSMAPLYTSDKILQKSLVTARVYNFFPDACARGGSSDCPLKGEQMIRIDLGVAESVGASWNEKTIYLTNKTYKSADYQGYRIELLSIDSQKEEASVVIRPVK